MPVGSRSHLHRGAATALGAALTGVASPASANPMASALHGRPAIMPERQAIAAVLQRSSAAWSRGDLDGFMACYEDGPQTSYIRPDGPVRGVAAIRALYAARFTAGGSGMGRLTTDGLDVRPLGRDYALVTGRYRLERPAAGGGEAHGVFTLVFHRGTTGWRIISDHTS